MKALWLISNRRGRRAAPSFSLFPFLAVLICTMGALVLLLLSVTREARLQAVRESSAKNAQRQSSIASEMEMVQWRVEQLKKSRAETEAQLTEARLALGHIEDHGRRLRNQFQDLSQQAKKASEEGLKAGRMVAAGEAELKQIEEQIAVAQRQLDFARQTIAGRPKSYAIIPYDGRNNTRRRPIYIECRGDAVVLQPENIAFGEADFDQPLGPGNPLAAAVRAAREQMLLQSRADQQNMGEPYPLLLVRPAGIAAYDAALEAMKSWGAEFGYELISEDWQLKYPPPDPVLARVVKQAVDLARLEHSRLIAAAPSRYGKRPRSGSYRSPVGNEDAGSGGTAGGDGTGFYSTAKPSGHYAGSSSGGGPSPTGGSGSGRGNGGGFGSSGGGSGNGPANAGGYDGHGTGPSSDADFAQNNPYAALPVAGASGSPAGIGVGSGPGYGPGTVAGGTPGAGVPGGGGPGASGAGGPPGLPSMFAGGGGNGSGYGPGGGSNIPGASGAGGGTDSPAMLAGGGAPSGSGNGVGLGPAGGGGPSGSGMQSSGPTSCAMLPAGPGSPSNTGNAGTAAGNPSGVAGNQYSPASGGQFSSGSAGVAGIARPDGYITGRPSDANPPPVRPNPPSSMGLAPDVPLRPGEYRPTQEPPKPDPEEEAKQKKKHPYDNVKLDHDQDDWALRNASRHAAAISRAIRIDCYPDRLVMAPEVGGGEPRVILCDRGGQRDADKLVAAVWEIMDAWGMAGREMYWRPILKFNVVPGAEPRMNDLTRSLDGSGLVIERKP